jgi:hypothetical protein
MNEIEIRLSGSPPRSIRMLLNRLMIREPVLLPIKVKSARLYGSDACCSSPAANSACWLVVMKGAIGRIGNWKRCRISCVSFISALFARSIASSYCACATPCRVSQACRACRLTFVTAFCTKDDAVGGLDGRGAVSGANSVGFQSPLVTTGPRIRHRGWKKDFGICEPRR